MPASGGRAGLNLDYDYCDYSTEKSTPAVFLIVRLQTARRWTMASTMQGCKWAAGAAVSIWLGVVGTAQARVILLEDPYNPGEKVAVEVRGCLSEARLQKLLPLVRQRPATDFSPSTRIAMASPAHASRFTAPLMIGVGF